MAWTEEELVRWDGLWGLYAVVLFVIWLLNDYWMFGLFADGCAVMHFFTGLDLAHKRGTPQLTDLGN